MDEKLKEFAVLLNKLDGARKTIREGIDYPLVFYDSSAYGFLMSAEFSLDNALTFLYGKYAEIATNSNQNDIKS